MAGWRGENVRTCVAAVALASALTACSGRPNVTIGEVGEGYQGYLEAHLARLQYDTGLTAVVAAVMTDGRLVAAAASGERRRGSGISVTVDDRWHVGSINKSMTATLLAVLEDDGLLSADDTVAALLPEFEVSAGWGACTLDHLLTHTAGAPANFPRSVQSVRPETPGELVAARRRFIAPVLARAPESPCGERFAYSNVGYTIAGHIAEDGCRGGLRIAAARARVRTARPRQRRFRSAARRCPGPGADRASGRAGFSTAHGSVRGARRQLAGDGSRGGGAHDDPRSGALRRCPPGRRIRPLADLAAVRGMGAPAHAGSRRLRPRLGSLRTRLGGRFRALAQRQQYVMVRAAHAAARQEHRCWRSRPTTAPYRRQRPLSSSSPGSWAGRRRDGPLRLRETLALFVNQ